MTDQGSEPMRRVKSTSSDESPEESRSQKGRTQMENQQNLAGFNQLFAVTQITGGLLCLLMLIYSIKFRDGFGGFSKPDLLFNWHPLLMTIGMVYLYANSIMIYRALRDFRKKNLKYIHASINGTIILFIIIAQVSVIYYHNATNKPNFYSLHSWAGILTMLIFFLQFIAGLVSFLYPGLPSALRTAILPLHVYFGLSGFVLAIGTCLTGLTEKVIWSVKDYDNFVSEGVLINAMGMLFLIFGLLVVYIVSHSGYKRYPRPEDNVLLTGVAD